MLRRAAPGALCGGVPAVFISQYRAAGAGLDEEKVVASAGYHLAPVLYYPGPVGDYCLQLFLFQRFKNTAGEPGVAVGGAEPRDGAFCHGNGIWRKTALDAGGGRVAVRCLSAVVVAGGDLACFDHFGLGEALALGCPATWAVYTLVSRQIPAGQTPLITTTFVCLIGTLGLLPLALWEGLPLATLPASVWLALVYLGLLGTVLGFVWYAEGIRTLEPPARPFLTTLVGYSACCFRCCSP